MRIEGAAWPHIYTPNLIETPQPTLGGICADHRHPVLAPSASQWAGCACRERDPEPTEEGCDSHIWPQVPLKVCGRMLGSSGGAPRHAIACLSGQYKLLNRVF